MKKVSVLLVALALIGGMSFSSCKKCSTCVAKDKTTGTAFSTGVETCGNKKAIDDYESAFKTTFGTNYDVVCE